MNSDLLICAVCGEPSTHILRGIDQKQWGSCARHTPGTPEYHAYLMQYSRDPSPDQTEREELRDWEAQR